MNGLFVPFKAKMGRPPKFTPNGLLKKFEEYLADRAARPITEETREETGGDRKVNKTTKLEHPHPISIADFCIFLGCSRDWWNSLSDDFLGVKKHIRTYIEDYQLKGASAGLFNANIVARLLGLADKQQTEQKVETRIVVETAEQKDKLEKLGEMEV